MPQPRRSPYDVLGLAPDASEEEIRRAARRLRQRTHPDRCGAPDAAERFREVQEAYEALATPEGRALAREAVRIRERRARPRPHEGGPPPRPSAQATAAAAEVWARYAAARESAERRRQQQARPDWSRPGWRRRQAR